MAVSSTASAGCDMDTLMAAPAFQGYSCYLSQANITGNNNNNKFYFMKIVQMGEKFYFLTIYGRVGEDGKMKPLSGQGEKEAVEAFRSTFKNKTGDEWEDRHRWEDRHPFVVKDKKYTLLGPEFLRVPLVRGALSDDLIAAGRSALAEVEAAVKNNESKDRITNLTSRYYTLVPHDYKRHEKLPVLNTLDAICKEEALLDDIVRGNPQ